MTLSAFVRYLRRGGGGGGGKKGERREGEREKELGFGRRGGGSREDSRSSNSLERHGPPRLQVVVLIPLRIERTLHRVGRVALAASVDRYASERIGET